MAWLKDREVKLARAAVLAAAAECPVGRTLVYVADDKAEFGVRRHDAPSLPQGDYVILRWPWWVQDVHTWRELADVLSFLDDRELLTEVLVVLCEEEKEV